MARDRYDLDADPAAARLVCGADRGKEA